MAKRRKTRKEKLMSDQRKVTPQAHTSESATSSPSLFSIPSSSHAPAAASNANFHEYDYVTKDLRKTAILTASLVIAEIVLAFILKV